MFDSLREFFAGLSWWQQTLIGVGLFAVTFSASLAAVGWFLVKIPPTFFLDGHRRDWGDHHSAWVRWTLKIGKNLFGLVLVVAGVIQLFMPGQGLLTILIGVVLLDFPGKRRVERKIVSRPKVLAAINRLRARFGQPPLIVEEPDAEDGARPARRPGSAELSGEPARS